MQRLAGDCGRLVARASTATATHFGDCAIRRGVGAVAAFGRGRALFVVDVVVGVVVVVGVEFVEFVVVVVLVNVGH